MELCEYLHVPFEPYWWDDCNHVFASVEVLEKLDIDIMHFSANAFVPKDFSIERMNSGTSWGYSKKSGIRIQTLCISMEMHLWPESKM
ncbi:MAG: hypothetical protein ACLRMZ_19725 [Blautia marasmi]